VLLPDSLSFVWIGEDRDIAALGDYRPFLEFHPDAPTVGFGDLLVSDVVAVESDRFSIVLAHAEAGCEAGDRGTYAWHLSRSTLRLTMESVSDDCPARAAAMQGDWTRSNCPRYPDEFCLGELDPGRHRSTFFTPRVASSQWQYAPGALGYSVPSGWSNTGDAPDEFILQPQIRDGEEGIFMWSEVTVVDPASPCSPFPDPTFDRSPEGFVDWLQSNPLFTTSNPSRVTVGGLSGWSVVAAVEPDADLPCVGDGRSYAPMLAHANGTGLQWGYLAGSRNQFFFLGLGGERTLVMTIEAPSESQFEHLRREVASIVGSLRFR
jgi:hypothetical protein